MHAQFGLQVRTRSRQALAPGAHVAVSSVIIGYSNKVSAFGDVSQQNRWNARCVSNQIDRMHFVELNPTPFQKGRDSLFRIFIVLRIVITKSLYYEHTIKITEKIIHYCWSGMSWDSWIQELISGAWWQGSVIWPINKYIKQLRTEISTIESSFW